jgi:hypothetical protein
MAPLARPLLEEVLSRPLSSEETVVEKCFELLDDAARNREFGWGFEGGVWLTGLVLFPDGVVEAMRWE